MTILSEYAQARSYYDSSLTIALAVHDSITQATVFSNRAIVFTYEEHYDKAIESYLKALNLYEISRNDDGMMRTYSNIAWVYSNINNIEQAGKYYRLAYDYAVKLNDKPSRYTILGNLASNLEQHGRLSEAKKLNHEVIAYYESTTPGSVQVGNIYFNVSKIHAAELDWDSSYYYAAKALELFKMREATKEIGYTYPILAEAELSLGKIKLAEQHALEGRRMNGELGTKTVLLRNLFTLVKIYRQQNNVPESRKYEDEFWMLSDSLDRENQAQAVLELQTKYETEEKTRENELLIKESELKDAKLAGGQYIVLSALLGLCLMGSLAFVLYQKNQHRGRLNQTLQTENEKLKVEMLVAQLNQLKDQINPHFLFNSLATLQSMAQEQDPNTGTFVQKLSEVYRYILQTNSDSLVSLKEELGVAEAYLFMLKARFEGALFISVKISDSLLSRKLPPSHYSC